MANSCLLLQKTVRLRYLTSEQCKNSMFSATTNVTWWKWSLKWLGKHASWSLTDKMGWSTFKMMSVNLFIQSKRHMIIVWLMLVLLIIMVYLLWLLQVMTEVLDFGVVPLKRKLSTKTWILKELSRPMLIMSFQNKIII